MLNNCLHKMFKDVFQNMSVRIVVEKPEKKYNL